MSNFTHLHVHSQYSVMDGLNTPLELMNAAKNLGQTAIAITDHGTLSGHRDMQKAAMETGIKPILGIEAYISATDRFDKRDTSKRDDNTSIFNHIILLAQNKQGLKNLNKLSEIAWTEGYYHKPRIDREILAEYKEGLIILSGCMNGLISKAHERGEINEAKMLAKWFKTTFGDNFYMEIQPHNPVELNKFLLELADEVGIKPIVTGDCHFSTKEERALEEAMLILSTSPKANKDADFEKSRQIDDIFERYNYLYPDRKISFEELDVYVMSREEIEVQMHEQGITRTDIYDNTMEIADSIQEYDFLQDLNILPRPKEDPDKTVREICWKAMEDMKLTSSWLGNDTYELRLEEELEVISKKDFSPYFLVISDMINWAKSQNIKVGPGRGSAAGSLVCYLLGITEVDPIKYDLLFFRFINEERNDFPDIDTDFEDRRRGEVKDYIRKKFKNVASISTFTYFKDKGVIRDAARVFMVPLGEVNKALKLVDTFEEFEESDNTKSFRMKYPEVLKLARELRGRIRSVGMHAAGVVVAKKELNNYAPIETRTDPSDKVSGRVPVVAYDMDTVADIGLIKLDVLGLKTLSVISDTLQMVQKRHSKNVVLSELALDDKKVYAMLSQGFTKGVFQAEATPYTNLLMKMGVSEFEDLAASNALVRPGAMNTVGANYINRKNLHEDVTYIHPIMKEFTQNTYGVIIYQEQVMQACVHLGGMSWAEADKVRKIIGKKKDAKEFDQFREKFVAGASRHISKEAAEGLWHSFEAHAGYSFNRSHAVAYSLLSYWTAWLKLYYPTEFMFAMLKNEGDKDARTDYLIEAKRLGIKILLPHVNESELDFSIQGDAIRFGLADVKYISENIGKKIISKRPYKNYADLKSKAGAKNSGINSRAIDALNAIGGAAFDDNPRTGREKDNLYEYLNIPKFDISGITPHIKSQINVLDDFEELGTFVFMAMVKSIKRGTGWSRVEIVDETASVGVFDSETTTIETGQMYFFLVGDNRIHRFVEIDKVVKEDRSDPFVNFLYSTKFDLKPDNYYVIDFTNYKTKAGKMMAHTIVSDENKKLIRSIVFPFGYARALGKMKPGLKAELTFSKTDDGTIVIKEIK
jgi:DNA polymerase-3 subunit alpha